MRSLIAGAYGEHAADAWERFSAGHQDQSTIAAVGREILKHFPSMAGASSKLTALLTWRLEQALAAPAYMVAGSLFIGGSQIFDGRHVLHDITKHEHLDPSWRGHAWAILGHHLIDLSLFHRAHWRSMPILATHVRQTFGDRPKILIGHHERPIGGLRYEAHHVFPQSQVEAIVRTVLQG